MQSVLITTEGIQKNLKSFKPLDAICEYIWNGFDAEADIVKVYLHENELGIIDMISVEDNGDGISYEELKYKFQPFNDSKKASSLDKTNHSLPRGRKGIGRLTFFAFAQNARWETVFSKEDQNYYYFIEMHRDSLNQYDDNGGEKPQETTRAKGTKVIFTQLDVLDKDKIIQSIKEEFFWFLELNKKRNFQILVNDEKIGYEDFVVNRVNLDLSEVGLDNTFCINIVQWNTSLGNEYSRVYYIDSNDKERYKETTKLNKRADQFYHSVFVTSKYFDNFDFGELQIDGQKGLFPNKSDEQYKILMENINEYLLTYRRNYLKEASESYIAHLVDSKVYPSFDPGNVIDVYRRQELDHLVGTLYAAQPKIFTGLSDDNKRITLELLKMIMDNGNKPELFNILRQIVDLDEEEVGELSDVLKYTTLNNITKVVQLLENRQKVIQGLKELVFDKDLFAKEVPHIQSVVENHYWIFGEQYNLITAAEPDFNQALQKLILKTTGREEKVDIEHEDKNKEMDIYMIRQDRTGDVTENVVVELKRPSVRLGEDQVSQVKRYMRVIKSDERFNAGNVKWTFFLVGDKYDTSKYIEGELESHTSYGEPHLIHSQDNGLTKIYVLKWSEVFDDYSKRHEFLMCRLKLEEELWLKKHNSADAVVEAIENS